MSKFTNELRRIITTPRREVEQARHITQVNQALRLPYGKMTLWPAQCYALADMMAVRGNVFEMPVGGGKGLISVLMGTLFNSKCHMIVVPAQLVKQTTEDVIPLARANFLCVPRILVQSYETISRNEHLLEQFMPETIFFDECQMLFGDEYSGRRRRAIAYKEKFPRTICAAASGSFMDRTLRKNVYVMRMCMDNPPVPQPILGPKGGKDDSEFYTWSDILDSEARIENYKRPPIGALSVFAAWAGKDVNNATYEDVQAGFAERMRTWPGVFKSQAHSWDGDIHFHEFEVDVPSHVDELFKKLRETWCTEGDEEIADHLQFHRYIHQLSQGYYLRWIWPGGIRNDRWVEAQRAWRKSVRNRIRFDERCSKYTYENVEQACKNYEAKRLGLLADSSAHCIDSEEYRAWKIVEPEYKPEVEAVWIDKFFLKAVDAWTEEHRGIAWTTSPEFGNALQRDYKVRYYGGGDNDVTRETRSCAAAVKAHGTGKNLQKFHKMLFCAPPSRGVHLEQNLGRMCRGGQQSRRVDVWLAMHCAELYLGFQNALRDAKFSQINKEPQLVLRSNTDLSELPDMRTVASRPGYRYRLG